MEAQSLSLKCCSSFVLMPKERYVCAYVCVCMCIHVHVYIYIYIYTCIYGI